MSRSNTTVFAIGKSALVLLLFAYIIPVFLVANASAGESAPTGGDRFAPLRDYSSESRKLAFGEKKKDNSKDSVKAGAAQTDLARAEERRQVKSKVSGSSVGALVIALVGIGLMVWVALVVLKKFLPGGKGLFSTPAMEILGRTQFDSQKYLALVRVGKRVLVVGVSSGGFDSIAEIEDEVEAADIMAIAKPKTSAGKDLFHKMFQRQVAGVEADSINAGAGTVGSAAGNDVAQGGSPIADIQARVRNLREVE